LRCCDGGGRCDHSDAGDGRGRGLGCAVTAACGSIATGGKQHHKTRKGQQRSLSHTHLLQNKFRANAHSVKGSRIGNERVRETRNRQTVDKERIANEALLAGI
jgi:hypothetical protein